MNVLVVDVGGTHVKIKATEHEERREFDSGSTLTAKKTADGIRKLVADWKYDAVSMGVLATVFDVVECLRAALEPGYVVIGGGNAELLGDLPDGVEIGSNNNAFVGGLRLWE